MSYEHFLGDAQDPDAVTPDTGVQANVIDLAREMKDLKSLIDALEADRKEAQGRYDNIRKRQLPDAMASAGLANIRLDSGELFSPRTEVYASVLQANRPAFFHWMRDHGFGSLIREEVNPQTLKAFAREQTDAGNDLPPQLQITKEPVIVMTKGKGK